MMMTGPRGLDGVHEHHSSNLISKRTEMVDTVSALAFYSQYNTIEHQPLLYHGQGVGAVVCFAEAYIQTHDNDGAERRDKATLISGCEAGC